MIPRIHSWLILAALAVAGCSAAASPPVTSPSEAARHDATELFRLGEQASARGDTLRAEQYLSMALDRGLDARRALPILLRVCLSSSRLRAALNHAEPYLSKHPNDAVLRYLVATIHLGLGQLDDARIDLNYLLRLDPNDVNAYYLLGVLEAGGEPDRARGHFRRYLQLAPTGEHAVEVRSRLTDLEIRGNLTQRSASARNGEQVIDLAPQESGTQTHSRAESVTWFGRSGASDSSRGAQ